MQTVHHSLEQNALPQGAPAEPDPTASRRVTQRVVVTPIVPRGRTLPTRESLQAAEDGGGA